MNLILIGLWNLPENGSQICSQGCSVNILIKTQASYVKKQPEYRPAQDTIGQERTAWVRDQY